MTLWLIGMMPKLSTYSNNSSYAGSPRVTSRHRYSCTTSIIEFTVKFQGTTLGVIGGRTIKCVCAYVHMIDLSR